MQQLQWSQNSTNPPPPYNTTNNYWKNSYLKHKPCKCNCSKAMLLSFVAEALDIAQKTTFSQEILCAETTVKIRYWILRQVPLVNVRNTTNNSSGYLQHFPIAIPDTDTWKSKNKSLCYCQNFSSKTMLEGGWGTQFEYSFVRHVVLSHIIRITALIGTNNEVSRER